ncbi:MAG: HAD-IB family phosphatase [Candidatus Bathyarchaeota archaeon]
MAPIKNLMYQNKKLIVFDIEGIIIPKNRYLIFEISRKVGFIGFIKIILFGALYETGLLNLESAMKKIFLMFKGLSEKEADRLYKQIPLIPGVEDVFKTLKEKGYTTALISSGLPSSAVKDLAQKLGSKYAYGLETETVNGHLTGIIGGEVLKSGGKAIVLKKILEKENLSRKECVVVADDRNNLSMFRLCGLKIGYNPDFVLTIKSDFVTKGALTEILLPITGEHLQSSQQKISKRSGVREIIHISSFFISFISMYLIGNNLISFLILLVTLIYIISEVARVRGKNLPIFSSITLNAVNKTEFYEFATAPINFALGIAISLLIFPAPIRYVTITILTLGDGFAHIFGMKFGRHRIPFNKGKNLEGSIFGFLFAFLGALLFIDPLRALIAATFGMIIEALPLPLNDNLTMPIATGLLLALIP